jgi:hypothetical protein
LRTVIDFNPASFGHHEIDGVTDRALHVIECSMFNVQCSMFNVHGSRFTVHGSRFTVHGSRFKRMANVGGK